ncbi:PREDICTED: tropomyosin [Ceratosolen solmsi marchali]|uniref:Tropomyosin n=1 Tax=Ceratosolen solmsi marchali TaxID=326594 RepID=A0AAJ7DW47_9HYME|nr:PREDICTED: tropomyosin [Ceratosolen solmsi marchali]
MSESDIKSFQKAAGDYTEVKMLDGNLEPTVDYDDNNLCKIKCATSDDNKSKKNDNADTKETGEFNNKESIPSVREEISKRPNDFYKKLEETQRKLSNLLLSPDNLANGLANCSEYGNLRFELEDLKNTLSQTKVMLEDRDRRISNQQNQISAFIKQVNSLKEVIAITKDMLNIRNMEVKHLQEDVDKMETKITAERDRHNAMIGKMDAAVRLNADLKKEYQTQLQLFQDLRGKYEEKVTILSEENKALEMAIQAQPAQ